MDAGVDEFGAAIGSKNEQGWHLALHDAAWEDDINAAAVVKHAFRPPGRCVSFDLQPITIVAVAGRRDRGLLDCWGAGLHAPRRIGPGDRRHVGGFIGAQFQQIGAPVGVDDEIGGDVGPGRLNEDVDASSAPIAAFGVADDPARGVPGGNRSRAGKLLAGFQCDVGDLTGRGIDLVKCAFAVREDLDRVVVSLATGLDAGRQTVKADLVRARSRCLKVGTEPPFARAASAGAANLRTCGAALSAMQQLTLELSFTRGILSPTGLNICCDCTTVW